MKQPLTDPGPGRPAPEQAQDLIVFDWDGTLVDSRRVIVDTLQATLRQMGLDPLPPEEVQQVIGLGLYEAIQTLAPEAGAADREHMRQIYGDLFKDIPAGAMPFFPGVEEGLETLKTQGRRIAVATGKSRRGLDRMLREWGMEDYFHATRCADETASKPDPRMLGELLGEFGVPAEGAVFVGDTAFDMEMAHRLGMSRLAVTYGVHAPERLAPWSPHFWAESFEEVLVHLGCGDLEALTIEG